MRKLFLMILTTILNTTFCLAQLIGNQIDNIGVKAIISQDKQYLKITNCNQGHPADIYGLKVGDRIYQIDNIKISELTDPISYLKGISSSWIKLTITSFCKTDFREIRVPLIPMCASSQNFVTESELSSLIFREWFKQFYFGNYKSSIVCLHDDSRDMLSYKTYDFEFTSVEDPLQEKVIFNSMEAHLNKLGLKRSKESPDLLVVLSFYSGQKEQYIPPQQIISTKIKNTYNWYWGVIPVPVTESTTKEGYTKVTYLANISLKFLDANEIEGSKTPPVIWSGSISQTSENEISLIDKCNDIFSVMFSQFPEVWQPKTKEYYLNHYAYTGIIYDKNDIKTIAEIIPGSPANKAGMQKGDEILSINECSLPDNYKYIVSHPDDFLLMMNKRESLNRTGLRYLYLYADWGKFRNLFGFMNKYPDMMTKPYKKDINTLEFKIKRDGENKTFQMIPDDRVVIVLF